MQYELLSALALFALGRLSVYDGRLMIGLASYLIILQGLSYMLSTSWIASLFFYFVASTPFLFAAVLIHKQISIPQLEENNTIGALSNIAESIVGKFASFQKEESGKKRKNKAIDSDISQAINAVRKAVNN